MGLKENDVEIRRPCPVKLDPARAQGGAKSWYCGHCEKSVHVLSNMTEVEARDFLGARVGEDLCVTYAVRKDGSIRFRPEPEVASDVVPVTALTRRRAAIAAAGLGLALAACAPHDNPDVRRGIDVADVPVMQQRTTTIPDQQVEPDEMLVDGRVAPEPDERIVEGGIKVPDERLVDGGVEPVPMKPGGITVAPLPPATADEPCDKPKPAANDKMVRGGLG
jgi:hypothetical protein